jgi:chromosome segregation ATPase
MKLDELIKSYEKKLESLDSEIKELCSFSNQEDQYLCKKLKIKSDCYRQFIKDLNSIKKSILN